MADDLFSHAGLDPDLAPATGSDVRKIKSRSSRKRRKKKKKSRKSGPGKGWRKNGIKRRKGKGRRNQPSSRKQVGRPTVYIDSVADARPVCPDCHVSCHKHDRSTAEFVDAPQAGNRPVIQRVVVHRWKCPECRRTATSPLPFAVEPGSRMTADLMNYLADHIFLDTVDRVSRETGLSHAALREVALWFADIADRRVRPRAPRFLGMDEVHLSGGAFLVLTDLKPESTGAPHGGARKKQEPAKTLDMLPSRSMDVAQDALRRLGDLSRIEWISVDMCQAYLDAIDNEKAFNSAFTASVVIDKRHTQVLSTQALQRLLTTCRKSISGPQKKKLKYTRYFNKRKHNLKKEEKESMAVWTALFPEVAVAYRLKEDFHEIFNCKDLETAIRRYETWKRRIPESLEDVFGPVRDTVERLSGEIFNYYRAAKSVTNAPTEALNGSDQRVNSQGRGYSFVMVRARAMAQHGIWKTADLAAVIEAERQRPGYAAHKRQFLDALRKSTRKGQEEFDF